MRVFRPIRTDFSKFSNFTKCKTQVKTADEKSQQVIGWINVNVTFKDQIRNLSLFIIPILSQKLILEVDLNLEIGYAENSEPLTAFSVPSRPIYQFVVIPFGLCNAS